jgi:hypothetical protein
MAMSLQRVQEILATAQKTHDAGAKQAAARITEHSDLRTALDWLVTRSLSDAKREAEMATLCTQVLEATRLMPALLGQPAVNTIGSIRKFDKAIRALKKFVKQLADEKAKGV